MVRAEVSVRARTHDERDTMRSRISTMGLGRALLAVAVAASLGATWVGTPAALADTGGSATIHFDQTSCLGSGSTDSGTVDYTRDGKTIDVNVTLTGEWSDGAHGVLLFVLSANGNCPNSGQFLGSVTTSGGSGSNSFSSVKIQPARNSHDVTVVLCVGDAGPHFSDPVTLSAA
jgi:hypothetical protein